MASRDQSNYRPTLMIIIASIREGRVGLPVGRWFEGVARDLGTFDIDFVDLAELDLPLMTEPFHPSLQRYTQEVTKAWSRRVAAADAFALVMPEYNHSFSAPLKNALDYLFKEWASKPVGFVSYGGVSAGSRAVAALQPVLYSLQMQAVPAVVHIPFVSQFVNAERAFVPNNVLADSAGGLLQALLDACREGSRRG